MKHIHAVWVTGFCGVLSVGLAAHALAEEAVSPPAAPANTTDRLLLSGNGSHLSGDLSGSGGQVAWLHDVDHLHFSAAGEYQTIDTAHWAFGSLAGAYVAPDEAHSSVLAEVHEGTGRNGRNLPSFRYGVEALGLSRVVATRWTLQLEDRQFDVDTTHGNLPRAAVALLWNRHVLSTLSYAHSVSGNLQTEVSTARLDFYAGYWSALIGGATGHAAPVVLNLQPGLSIQKRNNLNEGFAGLARAVGRSQVQLAFDYLNLGGQTRGTATLSLTLPLNAGAR
jgi:hypothetical protein